MQETYQPAGVERAVQDAWRNADVYRVTETADKPNYYACSMLP